MTSLDPDPRLVLLAEGDESMRTQLAADLRADGYRVIAVKDGTAVCDYLELARFSRGRLPTPDVIVSDVNLSGCGGIELCRRIAGRERSAPVILLAHPDDAEAWEHAEHVGAAHVLERPVDRCQLLDAVGCFSEDAGGPLIRPLR